MLHPHLILIFQFLCHEHNSEIPGHCDDRLQVFWIITVSVISRTIELGFTPLVSTIWLREACRQFSVWRKTLGQAASPSIRVNLPRCQLALSDLAETISAILQQTGVEPHCLHLEITESVLAKQVMTLDIHYDAMAKLAA